MRRLRTQFAQRLQALRHTQHLTQEELAVRTGLSAAFISSMERGLSAPSFETLEIIAKALKVRVADLFDFDSLEEK
jgi:transcriptional regulator with XRE-family HTH domain